MDEWIETYKKDGRPLPSATAGKNIQANLYCADLHQALAFRALYEGESLNIFVVKTLRRIVTD